MFFFILKLLWRNRFVDDFVKSLLKKFSWVPYRPGIATIKSMEGPNRINFDGILWVTSIMKSTFVSRKKAQMWILWHISSQVISDFLPWAVLLIKKLEMETTKPTFVMSVSNYSGKEISSWKNDLFKISWLYSSNKIIKQEKHKISISSSLVKIL